MTLLDLRFNATMDMWEGLGGIEYICLTGTSMGNLASCLRKREHLNTPERVSGEERTVVN